MVHRPLSPRRRLRVSSVFSVALAVLASTLLSAGAAADAIERNGLKIQNITIIGVEEGKLKYRTAAGDIEAPLKEIESIEVDSAPGLAAGQKAMAENQMRAAQRSLETVWSENRVPWIRHFAGYYLVQVYDNRGEPIEAATVYATLASEGADVHFLSKPPTASLAEADANQKQRITDQIMAVARDARGQRRVILQNFLTRVTGEGGPTLPVGPGDNQAQENAGLQAQSKVILPQAIWALLERRGEPKEKWKAIEQLSQGDAQAALDTVTKQMDVPGDLAPKLYLYARAKLELADATNDKNLYRDAGLAFMRIVVHFSRPGQVHPLVVPARLEVAYLHKKIGREDIYNTILFGGEGGGGLRLIVDDAEAYPSYRNRYYQIIGEQPPKDDE